VLPCPLWVKSGLMRCSNPCPLYPRKRTSSIASGMFDNGNKQTLGKNCMPRALCWRGSAIARQSRPQLIKFNNLVRIVTKASRQRLGCRSKRAW
jgi:hypothetical protein